MASRIEISIYKWVKKNNAIKPLVLLSLTSVCLSFFLTSYYFFGLLSFGVLTLIFCNDYRKWNKPENTYEYLDNNEEISEIINQYKTVDNIPAHIKIRLEELKSKNRSMAQRLAINSSESRLESDKEWGNVSACGVCRDLGDNEWSTTVIEYKSTLFEYRIRSIAIEFCENCGNVDIEYGPWDVEKMDLIS